MTNFEAIAKTHEFNSLLRPIANRLDLAQGELGRIAIHHYGNESIAAVMPSLQIAVMQSLVYLLTGQIEKCRGMFDSIRDTEPYIAEVRKAIRVGTVTDKKVEMTPAQQWTNTINEEDLNVPKCETCEMYAEISTEIARITWNSFPMYDEFKRIVIGDYNRALATAVRYGYIAASVACTMGAAYVIDNIATADSSYDKLSQRLSEFEHYVVKLEEIAT